MSAAAFSSRLLLIGWDAADWQVITPLIDAGQMPALAEMIEKGAMGNLATLQPVISPMLWTSIATGKTADKHGIFGFVEKDPETGNARPSSAVSRRTKAIWNIFQQARGWRCHVSNWWASHPAEPLDGITVSNVFFRTKQIGPNSWRVPAHSVHPPELVPEFGPLRMGINEVNEHLVLPFIPGAAEIDQKTDIRLERFAALMSDCCSEQAVATALLEREPWQFAAVYFDSIDHFSHGFMAYHPPRQPHVPEADFEMYRHVMTSVYRFHDMMLKRLIELAGPEATIVLCSDHGFQSGFLRPFDNPREPAGPIIGHRDFGILVMKGPGIKPDERIYGANLLDIAPTLLTLAGLPIGRDMDGKPLLEILESPTVPVPIDSWEEIAGRDGSHPTGHQWVTSEEDADEVMQQFAALGYIDDPTVDRREGGKGAELEGRYNLSQVYLSTARADEAVSVLENLVSERPWESRYIHQLANAYLKAGWFRAAEELLQRAYPPSKTDPSPPLVVLQMRVKAHIRRGEREGAAHLLSRLMTRMLRHPTTWVEAGWLWIELHHLSEAERCFRRAVELDMDSAAGWQGLSTVHLQRRENTQAIDAALEAVQRLHHLPVAHLNLGIALAREEQFEDALVAFRRVVGMRPKMVDAHRWLSAIYSSKCPNSFLAGAHRNEARRLSRERAMRSPSSRSRAEQPRPIPDIPGQAERREREEAARPLTKAPATSGRTFVVVSGLPRSGTSLMMQMLAAGGLPARTDGERTADEDNPAGYLEWEAIKRIKQEPHLLDEPDLEKKAIKVISALLPSLPRVHNYRVIYMKRPVAQIVASQAKMITHRGKKMEAETQEMTAALRTHSETTLEFLRKQSNTFQVLEVDFPTLVANPKDAVRPIAEFLGPDILPHPEKLAGAIRSELHRNRDEQRDLGK
jgi:predicted AlkP superfamily phosphohydrolase/phosphomutase/tetratricopeptide (TPR) repeat protein